MKRAGLIGLATLGLCQPAWAEGYRLRGEALAQAQAPQGVLALSGASSLAPGARIEAMVWLGAGDLVSPELDALVAAVSYLDPEGRGSLRAGRYVVTSGALPPIHMDGGSVLARVPWGSSLELFAGLPVTPRFGSRSFDWLAGGRLAQDLGPAVVGLAYYQRRDDGQLADQELGADGHLEIGALDLAARASLDLILLGLSQATIAAAYGREDLRFELSASQRSPARLLPATSLFTVLGDVATRSGGARVSYRAAPRLDLAGGGGARLFDDRPYADAFASARLRLGPNALRFVGVELRHQGAPDGGWVGGRTYSWLELVSGLSLSAEVELVRPLEPNEARGRWWPWALLAVHAHVLEGLELSLAGEARSTPEERRSFDLLLQIAQTWGSP